MLRAALISSLPLALAVNPGARWGHQAVYVPSQQAMYVVGGEVQGSGTQVTNEVLILPLNETNPSFSLGPNDALPPHAFAAVSLSHDQSSIVVVGGMTTACASDALAHTIDLNGDGWVHSTPSKVVRRRGAQMTWVDNDSTDGEMMLVGGVADSFSCASSTYSYPAADILSLPMSTSSLVSTRNLPSSLTGSDLAVSDFAMTTGSDGTIYLAGGQTATGNLVSLENVGMWTKTAGWTTQKTSGDVPEGRIGATFVAHPTLDILVLHGGSVLDSATNSDNPTALLSYLNTTTWTWTAPGNLQPPVSSAVSYHSSVMTPSGVMITAFGLGSTCARSDIFYLDMRDPTGSSWSWKSYWKSEMLTAFSSNTATTDGVDATKDSSAPPAKKITTIAVPVIVGVLLALPLIIYFIRRRVRTARKRRMARHFSFSSQEDNGDFASPLDQFRKTKTQFSFGRDANEKDGSFMADIGSGLVSILKRYCGSSTSTDRTLREKSSKGSKISEKAMNWEEIDFGLGQVDERRGSSTSRQSSFSAPSQSPNNGNRTPEPLPFPMPVASTAQGYDPSSLYVHSQENMVGPLIVTINDASPRVGSPRDDGQMPLVPSVVVMPPSTPSQELSTVYPAMAPAPPAESLDWNMLQQELEARPAFRSISPTSTLRSHAHPAPAAPSTIILVNAKTGRRSSEALPLSQAPRSISQPLAGRQLAGNLGRRGSAPFAPYSPSSSGSTTPTGHSAFDPAMRRASNPSVLPSSPVVSVKRESAQSRLRVINATEDDAGHAV